MHMQAARVYVLVRCRTTVRCYCMVPDEEYSRSGWLLSFLREVMMLSTPSEGSDALPDIKAATVLDRSTCLYTATCTSCCSRRQRKKKDKMENEYRNAINMLTAVQVPERDQ